MITLYPSAHYQTDKGNQRDENAPGYPEGYEKLKQELNYLWREERPESQKR